MNQVKEQAVLILRSNPVAPDPRVEKAARSLSAAGYTVTVVGWDRTAQLPTEQKMPGYTVKRLAVKSGYGHGLANLVPLLRWQVRLLVALVRSRAEFDLIHACDFDTVLPALICQKLFGKKVVYDIFDFYADHLRATPGWLKRVIRSVDLWAISQADAVILVDDARQQQIEGSKPKRLVVICNTPEDVYNKVEEKNTGERPGR